MCRIREISYNVANRKQIKRFLFIHLSFKLQRANRKEQVDSNEYVAKKATYRKQIFSLSKSGLRDVMTTVKYD